MNAFKRTASLCVIVAAALALAAAAAAPPPAPHGVTSRDAVQAFKLYETRSAELRAKLLSSLTAAKERVTKAGQLEEALRIKQAIDDLQANEAGGGGQPLPTTQATSQPATAAAGGGRSRSAEQLVRAVAGTSWTKVNPGNGPAFTITFRPDMVVTATHHAEWGTWAAVDGKSLRLSVLLNSCRSEVVYVSQDGSALVDADGKPDFKLKGSQ